jgi:hypothetical protein
MKPVNGKIAPRNYKGNTENYNPNSGAETFIDGTPTILSTVALGGPLGVFATVAANCPQISASSPELGTVLAVASGAGLLATAGFAASDWGVKGQLKNTFSKHSGFAPKAGATAMALVLSATVTFISAIPTQDVIKEKFPTPTTTTHLTQKP